MAAPLIRTAPSAPWEPPPMPGAGTLSRSVRNTMDMGLLCTLTKQISWPKPRSEEHTSELQSLMRLSYDVYCLKKKSRVNETKYVTNDVHQSISEQLMIIQYYIHN